MPTHPPTREHERLAGLHGDVAAWRRWGPYVAERAWGTVREDYSPNGDAWGYFPHDLARSKAYRWGEDGLAALLRPLPDPGLRPRLLERARPDPQGAAVRPRPRGGQPRRGRQGVLLLPRHHADALLLKWLYKYPQREYPYAHLVEENRRRGGRGPEYELLDTGIFDDDRYFDIVVEYAKATPEDVVARVTVTNRGPRTLPSTSCRTCGSATPGAGGRRPCRSPRSPRAATRGAGRRWWPTMRRRHPWATCPSCTGSGGGASTSRSGARRCSRTTRRTRSACGAARRGAARRSSRTRSIATS